ncbi:MAG TPA: CocE/NonD family hydrolase C-terminal non-catalytic domain-containing protein, partial [Polyangiaceae bacterium]|nr:CocE/NonD family hydrolase C-terminal non-catalytic domain-containing protein [Polyangiaceae bacterium]
LSHSIRTFTDDLNLTEPNAVADPNAALGSRLVFLGRALSRDLRISGTPHVDLKIRVNEPTTEVTARLVDYGPATRDQNYLAGKGGIVNLTTKSCWGDSSSVDSACYFDTAHVLKQTDFGVITRGWVDAAHRNSLTHPRALEPSKWYDVNIPFNATDAVIPAGHVLGLVIVGSDNELTNPLTSGATIDVDVSASSVTLPLVQCPQDAVATAVAPAVHAPRAAEPFAAPALDKRALFLSSFQ